MGMVLNLHDVILLLQWNSVFRITCQSRPPYKQTIPPPFLQTSVYIHSVFNKPPLVIQNFYKTTSVTHML